MESAEGEMRAWNHAERQRDKAAEKKRRLKDLEWTEVTLRIKVPICPKCGKPMRKEMDQYWQPQWEFRCDPCQYWI